MLNAILREFLVRTAAAAGADLTLEDVEKFSKYGDLLLEWNKIMNLTAVTDERDCPETLHRQYYNTSLSGSHML